MPYVGVTRNEEKCAICNKKIPPKSLVYFDSTKSQGKHLVHKDCWDELRKSRGPSFAKKSKKGAEIKSRAELDPPY